MQSERENRKIGEHMALANKQVYVTRSLNKQPAERVDSGTNENNGNVVVQASRQYSITNNKTTTTYQIP